jgi:hypothetical protein
LRMARVSKEEKTAKWEIGVPRIAAELFQFVAQVAARERGFRLARRAFHLGAICGDLRSGWQQIVGQGAISPKLGVGKSLETIRAVNNPFRTCVFAHEDCM